MSLPEFEELVKLAKNNPEELERLRQKACDELIEQAPVEYQRKLRGLQFKIDMERRRARTPMAACLKISEMMHDSFGRLRKALNDVQGVKAPTLKNVMSEAMDEKSEEIKQSSSIVEFPATT